MAGHSTARPPWPRIVTSLAVLAALSSALAVAGADDPKLETYEQAYRAGVSYRTLNQADKSREAFEQALKLAPDDKTRVRTYRTLLPSYRLLREIDKTLEAFEFIVTKSDSEPERSLARSELISSAYHRGKLDAVIDRYEKRLSDHPNDRTSLYILSEIYDRAKRNPKRGAQIAERLAELNEKEGGPIDVRAQAQLASQYVRSGKVKEGAELFEQLAKADPKLAAWHWKEAAVAWLKAKQKDKALAAARASAASPPEERGALLEHFWHRALGDVFLETGEPGLAIPQYEKALEKTDIAGYQQDIRRKLAEARAKAG